MVPPRNELSAYCALERSRAQCEKEDLERWYRLLNSIDLPSVHHVQEGAPTGLLDAENFKLIQAAPLCGFDECSEHRSLAGQWAIP